MRSFRQIHQIMESLTIPTLTESGVAGADRILRADVERVKNAYVRNVLQQYDPFISAELTGSISRPEKADFGDMDLLIHVRADNKVDAKKSLAAYLMTFPETVFGYFKNPKYLDKRVHVYGEIVSVRYLYDRGTKSVQIDNMIALSASEVNFKQRFLDFPTEKQGLILGLVKVAAMEESPESLFRRLGLRLTQQAQPGQEWEFNLNSEGLALRLATFDAQHKEMDREEVWHTDDWNKVVQLLAPYDLSLSFEELYDDVRGRLKHPRSKSRIIGVFKAMVRVKSGEVGTPKGDKKLQDIDKMSAF